MIELKTHLIPHPKPLDYLLNQFESLLQDYLVAFPNQQYTAPQIHQAIAYARVTVLPSLMAHDAVVYLLKTPFNSFTASGKWQNEFIYVTRNGRTYLKRYCQPTDRKSAPQLTQRDYFRTAVAHYQQESAETKLFWKEHAKNVRGKSGYNLYLGEVMKLLKQGVEPSVGFRG